MFVSIRALLVILLIVPMLGACGYEVIQEGNVVRRYESTQAGQTPPPVTAQRPQSSMPGAIRPASPQTQQGTVEETWRVRESCSGPLGCAGRGSGHGHGGGYVDQGHYNYDPDKDWSRRQAWRARQRDRNRWLHERYGCNPCLSRHGWR